MNKAFSILLLISYLGVFHHDDWFALLGVEHHHGCERARTHSHDHHHNHSHHHHHNHKGDGEKDEPVQNGGGGNSVPFPDTHSFALSGYQRSGDGIDVSELGSPEGDDFLIVSQLFGHFDRKQLRSATEDPPPLTFEVLPHFSVQLLSHSVQSNAPPALILV